ncbi:MAG TPA: nuclear transport factor 2 family protein [Trebonia sp.]|jgi:hypothetical protein|nr:nuclear transport factor 2 family protein [Trebonia sp.]
MDDATPLNDAVPLGDEWAGRFVGQWVSAWNAHDVPAVVAHFADDAVFSSPVMARILGTDGVIRGRQALLEAWTEGVRNLPDLHFEVIGYYVGVATLVINYRNQRGGLVCEVLTFSGDGRVREGHGTYLGGAGPGR